MGHTEAAGGNGIFVTDAASATIEGFDGFDGTHPVVEIDSTALHVHACVHDDVGISGKNLIKDDLTGITFQTVNGFDSRCYDSGETDFATVAAGQINQTATSSFAGSCTMSAATTCTFTSTFVVPTSYTAYASLDPTATVPATANSAKCAISGTTVTITAGIR